MQVEWQEHKSVFATLVAEGLLDVVHTAAGTKC